MLYGNRENRVWGGGRVVLDDQDNLLGQRLVYIEGILLRNRNAKLSATTIVTANIIKTTRMIEKTIFSPTITSTLSFSILDLIDAIEL